jgi:pimeloyl-ACP methyl ester carboxylesterase
VNISRAIGLAVLFVSLVWAATDAQTQSVGPLAIAKQGSFFVGGHYVDTTAGPLMYGQSYVEYQIPQKLAHRFPIVMIEGCCASGATFAGTPDGRDGWVQYFLARGYTVYLMDQVGRGRSQYVEGLYGKSVPRTAKNDERDFTANEKYNLFPQAHLHTQWPGGSHVGEPAYDQFYASQLPDFSDRALREKLNRDAGIALLDKIGPAILMPHSQAGFFTWPIADARPSLVKGIVAVEAGGATFHSVDLVGPPAWFNDGPLNTPWGLTSTPITFSPPVNDPSEIAIEQQAKPDRPDLVRCWLQKEPARRLVNLVGIPIMIVLGEASFAAPVLHCQAAMLKQAGVANDFVRLSEIGIHGNGHLMMLEKNNLEIAGVIANWLRTKGL